MKGVLGNDVTYTGVIDGSQIASGTVIGKGVTFDGILGSSFQVSAANIQPGNLNAGVKLTSDVLASQLSCGTSLPQSSLALPSCFAISGNQITSGTIGSNVVFNGILGSSIQVPSTNIQAGNLNSNVKLTSAIEAVQINSGLLGSGVVLTSNIQPSQITAGALNANVTLSSNISPSQINSGALNSGVTLSSNISTSQINAGALSAGVTLTSDIHASQVQCGASSADSITLPSCYSIDGSQIKSGTTIGAGVVFNGVLGSSFQIASSTIQAGNLNSDVILTSNIQSSQVSAGNLNSGVLLTSDIQSSQVAGGNLASNVILTSNIQSSQVLGGNLRSDVLLTSTIRGEQVNNGTIPTSVTFQGVIGSNALASMGLVSASTATCDSGICTVSCPSTTHINGACPSQVQSTGCKLNVALSDVYNKCVFGDGNTDFCTDFSGKYIPGLYCANDVV